MKNYDLKTVLLALREDYLDIQKKLDKVKDYIDTDYDKKKLKISIDKANPKAGLNIGYVYDANKNRSFDDYSATNSGVIYHSKYDEFTKDPLVNVTNKKAVREIFKEVADSNFTSNIKTTFKESCCSDKRYYNRELIVLLGSLLYYETNCSRPEMAKSMLYLPTDDKLYFERSSMLGNINDKVIKDALDAELPGSIFMPYHLEKIEKYECKPIEIINERKGSNREAYKINEEPKRLVLKR